MPQPHSLGSIELAPRKPPLQEWEKRHGSNVPKGTVLPETTVLACPRVKVSDLPEGFLKQNHIDHLEQNQTIRSCCRHPENHEVEAFKSHPDEQAPDIYVFHCTCGRKHRFFCVGMTDTKRPVWEAS
jgi:hypothetical protein